ncbi:MAG TPA: hypothetical protein VJ892_01355 [Candidatus Absconditabacterales bacterium]|nr:hypothetical protein [Candidatus Absconditabacterales bacterium]
MKKQKIEAIFYIAFSLLLGLGMGLFGLIYRPITMGYPIKDILFLGFIGLIIIFICSLIIQGSIKKLKKARE